MAHSIPVAYFVLSPILAGVENVVFQILKHLNKGEIKPFLIVSKEIESHFKDLLPTEDILVLDGLFYQPKNKYLRYLYPMLSRKFKWKHKRIQRHQKNVIKFIKKHQIEVLHSHLLEDHLLCWMMRNELNGVKTVITVHGTLALDPEDNYKTWLSTEETLEVLSCADAYTSACKYFVDNLALYGVSREKFEFISNGIDIDLSNQVIENRSKTIPNSLVFLGGGRVQQKGGDILIKAIHMLVHELDVKDVKLFIYGTVPQKTKERILVEQLGLQEHIFFQGFVSPPAHLHEMIKHEVFVLPSRHEGVANSLMEAIGLGMKIVATNVGGTQEVLGDYNLGVSCFPNAQEIAFSLNAQLNAKNTLSLEFRNQFVWEQITLQYQNFYRRIIIK
jgi:glycosyltransferase involved in cell wall biosynthesis